MGTVIVLTSKSHPNYVVACKDMEWAKVIKDRLNETFWEGDEFEIQEIPVLSSLEDLASLPK